MSGTESYSGGLTETLTEHIGEFAGLGQGKKDEEHSLTGSTAHDDYGYYALFEE